MRRTLRNWFAAAHRWLSPPPPDQTSTIRYLADRLAAVAGQSDDTGPRARYMERVAELAEARVFCGAGPWLAGPAAIESTDRLLTEAATRFNLKESQPPAVQGAYGDLELALQNVEWRREVNLSWLEFSRWGIQQIILVARLHYIKNPIIRRLVDVCAAYVFARGCSVTSGDEAANEAIQDFLARNKATLGQNGLTDLERRKDYDGNLFFVLFTDTQSSGDVRVRTIDATEIVEIVTDPEDADTPRYYKRRWTQQAFDEASGQTKHISAERWYPAVGYEPTPKPPMIGKLEVVWDSPVLHRKAGAVAKWHFGCPRIYPAIDWAKESRRYLESCASVAQSLAQIALTFTTKGGQQALAGAKEQLGSGVNAGGPSLWDPNPPSTAGGTFASGPGTKLEAFKTSGAGLDPEKVRQYKLMCCMVAGVPETFLADVSTGNLATATSLDRPTETVFLEKQEAWREDLVALCSYQVRASMRAPKGRIREALQAREGKPAAVPIREAARVTLENGRRVYEELGAKKPADGAIEIRAEFPAIREGDLSSLVSAVVEAMTLGASGTVCGIDEKEGVRKLFDLLGIEGGDELVEQMYPEGEYDPERKEDEPEPIDPAAPGGVPGATVKPRKASEAERLESAIGKLGKVLKAYEASRDSRPN
jgi:hypothetical protein